MTRKHDVREVDAEILKAIGDIGEGDVQPEVVARLVLKRADRKAPAPDWVQQGLQLRAAVLLARRARNAAIAEARARRRLPAGETAAMDRADDEVLRRVDAAVDLGCEGEYLVCSVTDDRLVYYRRLLEILDAHDEYLAEQLTAAPAGDPWNGPHDAGGE